MIEKAKALLQNYPVHSKVIVIGFFSIIFLILIVATFSSRVSEENTAVNPTPAPVELIPGEDYVQGQIMVKFKEGLTDTEIDEILSEYEVSVMSIISGINVKVLEVPVGQEEIIKNQLIERGVVEYAEFNHRMGSAFTPNDSSYGLQYGLKNTGQSINGKNGTAGMDIKAEAAWDVTRGSGVKVAVLDTGVDVDHPEFAGKIVAQETFVGQPVDDTNGHGTHVSGTVSTVTNNSQGIAGTCPECQLMIGKVLGNDGTGDEVGFSNGVIWAADNGAKVINLSITFNNGAAPAAIRDAISYAWDKGAIIVAAAGNCGGSSYVSNRCSAQNQTLYPASFPNVISVANIDNSGQRHSTSNHGTNVDVAAFGTDIYSTLPVGGSNYGSNYGGLIGTSMASPMVSGVAALVRAANPSFTNQQIVDRLFETADPIEGTGTLWQKGRVNAARAVGATESANLTPTVAIGPTITATPGATISPTVTEPPPFVCGGSPNNICTSPTVTIPPIDPGQDCLDPRGTTEKINSWVDRFILRVKNYINAVIGNPQQPPPPPIPCVVR